MEVLDYFPIILTKDANWMKTRVKIREGSVVVLPQDAILIKPKSTPSPPSEV